MWGNWNSASQLTVMLPLWKTVLWVLKKLNMQLPYDPALPLLGIDRKELKAGTRADTCMPVFTAALCTRANRWKQPRGPSADEGTNRMWSLHTMEYYLAVRRNEVLIHATAWMNLEDMMWSHVS